MKSPQLTLCSNSSIGGRVDAIIELWKKNRSTLGLFPRGAFEEHAEKGWIVYLLDGETVAGYLLYRLAKERAAITHLCVNEIYRGTGGARKLFEFFRSEVEDGYCRGVEVKCREDYDISPLWPKLDFQYVKSVPGRGKDATTLVKWFFHFDTSDFFYDMMPKPDDDDQVWAVLDANVLFKLSQPDEKENLESAALLSETVSSYTRYWVTPEIYAEIERRKVSDEKIESRSHADRFDRVEAKRGEIDRYKEMLAPIWEDLSEPRDQSDFMHIVYAAAASISVFITQDGGLLDKANAILDRSGIRVVRPVEFISGLDALENESKYNPSSIARTQYSIQCPLGENAPEIAKAFACVKQGEKQSQLEAKIRAAIANTEDYQVSVVRDADGQYLVLLVEKQDSPGIFMPLLRHDGSAMAQSLMQDIIWKRLAERGNREISQIRIVDEYAGDETLQVFSQRGFFQSNKGLERYSLKQIVSREHALKEIEQVLPDEQLHGRLSWLERESLPRLEEAFWPLKIEDSSIPTFLVPIQPTWAMHLFDEGLASQQLLGADPNRFFNWENVYYRSSRSVGFEPGARILWYVSGEKGAQISEIRACSRMISSEIDQAKTLFQKYRRLGIYEWRNLMKLTDGDPYAKLMAMRFYQTECFETPIRLEDFDRYGIKSAPYGPRSLTNNQFCEIYRKGMNIHV